MHAWVRGGDGCVQWCGGVKFFVVFWMQHVNYDEWGAAICSICEATHVSNTHTHLPRSLHYRYSAARKRANFETGLSPEQNLVFTRLHDAASLWALHTCPDMGRLLQEQQEWLVCTQGMGCVCVRTVGG